MHQTDKIAKKTRGRAKLASLTYATIADWSGLSVNTCRKYASQGVFNARDLHSAMQWINEKRVKWGWPLIGQPEEITKEKPDQAPLDTLAGATLDVKPLAIKDYGYSSLSGEIE